MQARHVVTAVLAWAATTVVIVLVGLAATLALAAVTTRPTLFLVGGAAAAAGAWVVAWFLRRRVHGGAAPSPVPGIATGLVLVVLAVAVLVPLGDPGIPPEPPPGASTWTLADGNHLAYGVVRARRPTADADPRPPVVVLHGGPGVPDLAGLLGALGPLADAGRDVYAYARVGSGRSSRLQDPSGYTVARAVDELEQVRRTIGASRIVLVGHSYGGYLAAAYLAAHPGRVARVVFSSPGDLQDGLSGSALQQRLSLQQKLATYRLLAPPRAAGLRPDTGPAGICPRVRR